MKTLKTENSYHNFAFYLKYTSNYHRKYKKNNNDIIVRSSSLSTFNIQLKQAFNVELNVLFNSECSSIFISCF